MMKRSILSVLAGCMAFGTAALANEKPDPNIPTPEAAALIAQVKAAYGNLKGLKQTGKLSADLDVGGNIEKQSIDFAAEYRSPTEFRHEVKGELVAGATGQRLYVYQPKSDRYAAVDLPAARGSYRQLPGAVGQVLDVQDPSLAMAISANSVSDLIEGARKVRVLVPDPKVAAADGLTRMAFTSGDGREIQFAFDTQSHLLRQASYDLSEMIRGRGAEAVKKAIITIDYGVPDTAAKFDGNYFAWVPPASAREISATADAMASLEGQPAPDFTLNDLDGKPLQLSSLKGSVILIDFWATWCPPCVRSLPEIEALHTARKAGGLKVLAVNAGEEKALVQKFIAEKKLTLPVLLDTEEKAAAAFSIRAYPTTIIIRPDGIIQKVFVGIPEGGKSDIERELDAAAK